MSLNSTKVSVILPVKNGDAALLKRAVASVQAQTLQDFEILLVDNGSEAAYAAELDRIAKADKRIRLFHIDSSGVSGARNFAAEQASGEILTYLDSDDALSPCCFEEAAVLLKDPETDALWGGTWYFENADLPELQKKMRQRKVLSEEELKKRCIRLTEDRLHKTRAECIGEPFRFEGGYINRGIAARFIKREAFQDGRNQFPPGIRMYEDAIWNLKMLGDLRISYVQRVWYYYFSNEDSASNAFNPDILNTMEEPLEILRGILDLEDPEEYAAYTRILMDSLRYVYKCLYGNPKWKPEGKERKALTDHIYNEEPWTEVKSGRFAEHAGARDKKKALLFKNHLLFSYWKLTWKKM